MDFISGVQIAPVRQLVRARYPNFCTASLKLLTQTQTSRGRVSAGAAEGSSPGPDGIASDGHSDF